MSFTQQEKVAILLVVLAVVLGAGILALRRGAPPVSLNGEPIGGASAQVAAPEDSFTSSVTVAGAVAGAAATPKAKKEAMMVHVGGAVVNPGVYLLPTGARFLDAVRAAGGGTPSADLDAMNLAARLIDGDKVAVPELASRGSVGEGRLAPTGASGAPAPKLDLNAASEQELESLPGVGPALAKRIADFRRDKGRFSSLKDLDAVSGIGPKMLERLAACSVIR